ncbi:MAG: response regulator [Sulfuricella denitrificans]|nr:response regulator [Sulfuricella denitrificans]
MKPEPTVFIVDDDAEMRGALCRAVRLAGMRAEAYDSAAAFLASRRADCSGCLLLDMHMPGMSGLELQQRLRLEEVDIPVIFLTGYGKVPDVVSAMKLGAVDFLEKPFENEDLIDRLRKAIRIGEAVRLKRNTHARIRRCLAQLTPRELEILELLLAGKANRAIAETLELSVRTVETHRANIMVKMEAGSLSDLVRRVLEFRALEKDIDIRL